MDAISTAIASKANSASPTLTGTITWTGATVAGAATISGANSYTATQKWAKGADVASPGGGALSVGTDGNYFDITGTNAITSITTVGVGAVIKLHFDAVLTLTHHATDLILPGGANITTAAGDEAEFVEYASGDWRCTCYTKADGTQVINRPLTAGTAIATTSGTSHDFTGIPSWVQKITIMVENVSTDGADAPCIQIGDSGGIETSGYLCTATSTGAVSSVTNSFLLTRATTAGSLVHGVFVLALMDSATNLWAFGGTYALDTSTGGTSAGNKSLTGTLDRLRLTTTSGAGTFDGGTFNIMYE